jgi:hypothetical protein
MKSQNQMTLEQMRETVATRLIKVRSQMRRRLMFEGVVRLILLAVIIAFFTFAFDWKFELSRNARVVCLIGSFVLFAYLAIKNVVLPAIARWGEMDIAGAIDRNGVADADLEISPRVASLFQMTNSMNREDEYSPDLAVAAAKENYEALKNTPFEKRLNTRQLRNSWFVLVAAIVVPTLLLIVIPTSLSHTWMGRWFRLQEVPWPRNTQISVVGLRDGKLIVPRAEPTDLFVEVRDKRDRKTDRIRLEFRSAEQKPKRMTVIRNSTGKFKQELAGLRDVTELRIWAGDAKFGPIKITPIERPNLIDVRLVHKHPWDNAPQVHDFYRGDGSISLLPKTNAELILKANVDVNDLQAEWNLSDAPKLKRIGPQEFSAKWEHGQDAQLRLQLIGSKSGLKSPHRLVSIGLKRDRPPSINMRPNGVRRRVTPVATIPLQLTGRDDFGIHSMKLAATFEKIKREQQVDSDQQDPPDEASGSTEGAAADRRVFVFTTANQNANTNDQSKESAETHERLLFGPIEPTSDRLVELEHRYSVVDTKLEPGDLLKIKTVTTDGCFTGKQMTETAWLTFSIVKPQELFREILIRQQQLRSRLRKATDRATDLRDSITTAQFPDDGRAMVREHRMIQRDVATVHRGLADSVREMELNQLGGPESIALIQKNVLEPLSNMAEKEMNEQRTALESLARGGDASQTEAIDRQSKIVEELKRVLKNMAQWDSFVDVVNQLDTVIKLQGKLKESTSELQKKDVESVFED